MTEQEISISGMHCQACVRRVTTALSSVPGVEVKSAEVGSATVRTEAGVPPGALVAALAEVGFEVELSQEAER